MPDLILLDGGRGHVGAIAPVLASMGIAVPLFGMVKDDKHRTRAIAQSGGEIAVAPHRSAFTLVSTIQDEVHRYSISFSRARHQKSSFELSLTKCEGSVKSARLKSSVISRQSRLSARRTSTRSPQSRA